MSRKIAYIDLTAGTVEIKPIPIRMRQLFLGGRGLDAYLLFNHTSPGIGPLEPDNVVLISAGVLVGTLASASARIHVMGKSPLTGFLGSTNIGGFFAPELRWAGFDNLVIKGKAAYPVYLWVHNGEIEIRDARNVWGKTVHESQQAIQAELGEIEAKILTIGPAGEKLVRFASVMTGIKDAGGRSGMGALLGSKNLKAIAARGTLDIDIVHPSQALEYNWQFIDRITSAKVSRTQGEIGTPFIWGATNAQGMVRTRNFQLNQLEEADDVEAEAIHQFTTGMAACFGCQVHCRSKHIIPEGAYAGIYGEGPEYVAQGAFASEPGCRSVLTILVGNHLANSYGLDITEVGSLIAWAMELYENGILTDSDTGGLALNFGNDEAVIEMVHRIARREGLGDILAEGPLRAAEIIGKDSLKYLIHVKGMSNLHSDERPTPALALGIATSSRGADHLRSRAGIDLYHLPEAALRNIYGQPVGYDGPLTSDYRDYEGKPWQVLWHELCFMAVDALGICKYHTTFLGPTLPNFEEWSKLLYYNTGLEMSPRDIWTAAERAYNMERLFNIREGLTRKDDWLVDRYFDEPTTLGIPGVRGLTIDRERFRKMIDEYYEHHGWDTDGVPTAETLDRLGIGDEPSYKL